MSSDQIKIHLISAGKTFLLGFIVTVAAILSDSVDISFTTAFWVPIAMAGLRAGITAMIAPFIPIKLGGTRLK